MTDPVDINMLAQDQLDAVAVLDEAVPVLQDQNIRTIIERQRDDHREFARQLQKQAIAQGAPTENEPHASNALKESWQKMWRGGGDKEILLALRANERVAIDKLKVGLTADRVVQGLSAGGVAEYKKALETELRHFQEQTDLLRGLGAAVDNDEILGAVRNAAEHVHAAINLTGSTIEDFFKWATRSNSE